jgi:hypothetical protein
VTSHCPPSALELAAQAALIVPHSVTLKTMLRGVPKNRKR